MSALPDGEPLAERPVLYFDFDNTITQEDVLDRVIERFSVTDDWKSLEDAWARREISTQDCLRQQVAGLRASKPQLLDFVAGFSIDPNFAPIVHWAASKHIELVIVSDNFACLVREILSRHGLAHVPLFANELTFLSDRPTAHFPFTSLECARCANCKVTHFNRYSGRPRIYVGDGLSDVCPALAADLVFAKDSLAAYLTGCGVAFEPFASLATVADFLLGELSSTTASASATLRMSAAVPAPVQA